MHIHNKLWKLIFDMKCTDKFPKESHDPNVFIAEKKRKLKFITIVQSVID